LQHIPDPEHRAESNAEVEITDLDAPPESGEAPGKPARRHRESKFRVRVWMSVAVIAGVALLVVTVLGSVLHLPEAAKVSAPSLPINYPVSLTVFAGVCYTSSTTGVVTAIRVSDGAFLWHHASGKAGEGSVTVVDGVIYLAPLLPPDSTVSTVTIEALHASDGSLLWFRTLPIDSPVFFQLTAVNTVVYIQSEAARIDALRASDGSSLWHYASQMPFVSFPSMADGVVYVGTRDGHLSALRASDGFPLWTYRSLNPLQTSPVVADGLIYLNMQKGGMDVLRADTGVLLWRYTSRIPTLGLYPQPLVVGGVVYVLTQDGHLSALHASNGSTIWRVALHAIDILPPSIMEGGVIYVETLDGSMDAIAESSGSVLWRYHGIGGGLESLTAGQGVIYLAFPATSGFNTIGSVTVLRASTGSVLWHYTPRVPAVQLVVGDDLALIALQDGSIAALHSISGSLRWRHVM
jgi:eukaryotic-like serine/threonine-protein kinase